MDLIDEKNRPLFHVREERQQVLRRFQRRPARHDHRHVQLPRQAGRKRRLAESGRPIEQNVSQRFAPLPRGIDHNIQPLNDVSLPNHLLDPLRAQRAIELFVALWRGRDSGFAGHVSYSGFRFFQYPGRRRS